MIFKRRKIDPLRETLYAIYHTKQGISRIEVLMDKISSRRERLLEIAAKLETRGESFLAKKYAAEIAKLDRIYNRLADLRLVLEKVNMSLEYALTLKNFREIASEINGLISELKKLPETTIPEIGLVLTNLEYSIKNLENIDYGIPDATDISVATDSDVNRIIEEAREIVKKKLEPEIVSDNSVV